ncbi:MAG: NAD(P)-dependent oxidoreductase [Acidimicrobiia bacterium]
MRALNELGHRIGDQIRAAVPDADVIDLGPDSSPAELSGDVLFGGWGPRSFEYDVPWVQLSGTGVDKVPPELLRGRVVTCARGASAVPISEFVLGAMLAFEKRFPDVWLHEPPEHWNFDRLGGLQGRTLGIVGLGGIGAAIAERALPFGMRVFAVRRTAAASPVDGVELVPSLDALLEVSDHVVLAVPLTPRTEHLLDAAAFAVVKPGVHLVNIARGRLVDQDALRVALDDDRVAMATLDTVDPEPLPAGHWLYEHPKVRLSAHISWASHLGIDTTVDLFVDNLRRHAAGEPLRDVVDPEEGY